MNQSLTTTRNLSVDPTRNLVEEWAKQSTDLESHRAAQLLNDKCTYVMGFFAFADKDPMHCGPQDVSAWIDSLRERGLKEASVYAMVSRVSSFYDYVKEQTGQDFPNPVTPVRPKAPKPYQNRTTKALTDDELVRLSKHLRGLARAENPKLGDLRDYAMFLMFMASGMRLNEIMQLKRGSVRITDTGIIIETRVKGGELVHKEIAQPAVENAMTAYLDRSGRSLETMLPDEPIWLSHDRAHKPGDLSASGYFQQMRKRALAVGIADFHPHMTRHTHARIVAEETGSIGAVQDSLGHANQQTTRVYVRRLGIRRDKHSDLIMDRMG